MDRIEQREGRFQSGTSFAAPFIASIVSLYLEAGAKPIPDLLRESLKRYAVDLGQSGKDQTFGWGSYAHGQNADFSQI